ncbi:hypothetical protein [Priestia megaterium]|nr:hypothetical protein [Priestia megaterium]
MTKTLVKAPFKADHVGIFLRTTPLKEVREAYANGVINKANLKSVEDKEI